MDADDEGDGNDKETKRRLPKNVASTASGSDKPAVTVAHTVDNAIGSIVNVMPTTAAEDATSDTDSSKDEQKDDDERGERKEVESDLVAARYEYGFNLEVGTLRVSADLWEKRRCYL